MVESTKGFGTMIKDMARDTKNTLMVIFTKESSKMVKHTAKASILGLLERPMKETGNKASRKDTEFGKRKMEILISENGIKAKLMAMEYILGKTEIGMRENGNTDLNMVKVLIFMLLVIPIQDSTLRVNLTVTENISGKMAVSTLEILKMASNMVKENGLKIKMHPILITMKVIISWTNKHGYGVFKWASGNVYKGNYKEDQRHGYGEMYWTDGSVYKGEWIRVVSNMGMVKWYFQTEPKRLECLIIILLFHPFKTIVLLLKTSFRRLLILKKGTSQL